MCGPPGRDTVVVAGILPQCGACFLVGLRPTSSSWATWPRDCWLGVGHDCGSSPSSSSSTSPARWACTSTASPASTARPGCVFGAPADLDAVVEDRPLHLFDGLGHL